MVAQTVVFSLMSRDMEMTSIQTLDFLPSRFPGMTWVQGPLPQCLSPDSGKMCREGHSFLVFFLLEHMTKISLSGLLIFVLFV